MSLTRKPLNPGRRGVILLSVFGFILLMAIFVIQFLDQVALQARQQFKTSARIDLRPQAYAALEVALGVLHEFGEIDGGLKAPAQGWSNVMAYAGIEWPEGITVSADIEDLGGKLNINAVPRTEMATLFDQMDIDLSDAETMIDALTDWIDDDGPLFKLNGAEADWYEDEGLDRLPDNAPLTSLDTLKHIRGWREVFFNEDGEPDAQFATIRDVFTVYDAGDINLNAVSGPLLQVLGEVHNFPPEFVTNYREGLDGETGSEDDPYFAGPDDFDIAGIPTAAGGTEMSLFIIDIAVSQGGRNFTLSALVSTQSGEALNRTRRGRGNLPYPFQILRLRENLPL